MSAQPAWSPVDDDTASLLSLVANDQMTDHADREWQFFVSQLHAASWSLRPNSAIDPNVLRELLRGHIAPRRIGAFTNRAKAEGLIEDTGEWVVSNDRQGRNSGKPCRVHRLVAS